MIAAPLIFILIVLVPGAHDFDIQRRAAGAMSHPLDARVGVTGGSGASRR
jgi:hypothetical protein